jgi:meso-butanediol dehydrogenase / (S,S)-butanediol dehydrogenase / diacetyl reductase
VELEGQTAIVTGAGQGIGRAVALELAALGADVAVVDLNPESAQRTAEEVRGQGRRAISLRVDVRERADVEAMVRRTIEELGRIDILVNNAGINRRAAPAAITDELWDAIMSVNAKGVLYCVQAVLPYMLAARRGKIISTASQSGKIGSPTGLVYCASKAAVISMTRSLALAYARDGILATCVCPGSIDTPMWDELDATVGVRDQGLPPGELKRRRAEQIPIGRLGTPEDVARVFGFLASSKSDYMTGQAINVTGGLVMF